MTTAATITILDAFGVQQPMNTQKGVSGSSWQFVPEVAGNPVLTTNPLPTAQTPNPEAGFGLATVATNAVGGSLQVKNGPGNLYSFQAVASSTSGVVMLFDATTVPPDGAVAPRRVYPLPAGVAVGDSFDPPLAFTTGILIVFSTTGPFTKTISATAFLAGEAA